MEVHVAEIGVLGDMEADGDGRGLPAPISKSMLLIAE
jgi:hypothetical protein